MNELYRASVHSPPQRVAPPFGLFTAGGDCFDGVEDSAASFTEVVSVMLLSANVICTSCYFMERKKALQKGRHTMTHPIQESPTRALYHSHISLLDEQAEPVPLVQFSNRVYNTSDTQG